MKHLILGGVRSGKSRFAASTAKNAAEVTVIATATAGDDEMRARIARHRQERPPHWITIEAPIHLAAAIGTADGIVIVDCLTLWLTNLLDDDALRDRETRALLDAIDNFEGQLMLVGNETGFGIMPTNAMARRFGDLAGELHQAIAARCERVTLMVAGLPITVKESQ